MNIGLVYNNNIKVQTHGGGYTIQQDLLNNIEKIKDNNISLTLITLKELASDYLDHNKSKFTKIIPLKRNIFDRFRESLIRNFNFISERSSYKSKLDKICLSNNLDIVIFLDDIHTIYTNFPFVTIVYDVDHIKYPFFPEYSKNNKWYKRENNYQNHLKKASAIISGTDYGISQISKYYGIPENKLYKIPHPSLNYDLTKNFNIDDNYIDTLGLKKNKFLFYPAQFWAHKNHNSLISLGLRLKEKFKDSIKIVLSGSDKGNLNFIKEQIKVNNLDDIIYYIGFISRDQLFTLYKNCLALTYVSYGGPENLPPLEAFSLGCPVIATKNEGSVEQLEDGAILINPNNSDELMRAIMKLQDEKFRSDLILKGKKVSEKKSIDKFMESLKMLVLDLGRYIETWKKVF